jgi:aminopeptidase-like protein
MSNMSIYGEVRNLHQLGIGMYDLIAKLYPICRSITGDGVRQSLHILQKLIPLVVNEVPTGTRVFDWTIPKEWNVRDAYVKNSLGEKVIDFQVSNLHLLNYSIPIHRKMSLSDLREHLFTLPEQPDLIPYRTSYYKENWGFCLSYNQLKQLGDGEYEVFIDSSLENGYLTYGEYYLPGEVEDEVLFSCHTCHPSLCNDNLSGIALASFLAKHLSSHTNRYSYRFLFIPGTIGSIAWLSLNEAKTHHIKYGLVISGVGDAGGMTYKKSRRSNAEIDRIAIHILSHVEQESKIEEFSPYGYDERQYCSPGFDLPVGRLTRTPFGKYAEYHTSADNLEFVKPSFLADSLGTYLKIVEVIENNKRYLNINSKCEPQLGKRGLYGNVGGEQDKKVDEMAMLWVLNLSDGTHTLFDIAERAKMEFPAIKNAAIALKQAGLLQECPK